MLARDKEFTLLVFAGIKHSTSSAGVWGGGEVLQNGALQAQDLIGPLW